MLKAEKHQQFIKSQTSKSAQLQQEIFRVQQLFGECDRGEKTYEVVRKLIRKVEKTLSEKAELQQERDTLLASIEDYQKSFQEKINLLNSVSLERDEAKEEVQR